MRLRQRPSISCSASRRALASLRYVAFIFWIDVGISKLQRNLNVKTAFVERSNQHHRQVNKKIFDSNLNAVAADKDKGRTCHVGDVSKIPLLSGTEAGMNKVELKEIEVESFLVVPAATLADCSQHKRSTSRWEPIFLNFGEDKSQSTQFHSWLTCNSMVTSADPALPSLSAQTCSKHMTRASHSYAGRLALVHNCNALREWRLIKHVRSN